MNQLTYIPGTVGADAIGLDGGGSFVGIASNLRSRAWAYKLGYRDIETANRPAREVSLDFETDYATADAFRRAADADVLARTPGMFLAQGEWRQRGYITSAEPSYIHYGRLGVKLGCILLEGAWWRVRSQSFAAENTVIEDRYESATGEQVVTVGADSAPLHSLSIEGKSVQDGTPTPSAPVPIQVVEGINLYDPQSANVIEGYFDTTIYTASIGRLTYYIPCKEGETYTASRKAVMTNERFSIGYTTETPAAGVSVYGVKSASTTQTVGNDLVLTITAGANAKYIVVWVYWASETSALDSFQIAKSGVSQPYVPYGAIGLQVSTPNLFNGTYTRGYLNSSGEVVDNAQWVHTDYMPVSSGTLIIAGQVAGSNPKHVWCDASKTVIGYESVTDGTKLFNVPSGAAFIRCSLSSSIAANFSVRVANVTPIPLDGNVLASLPDGTKDVLTVDPTGHVTLTKNVGVVTLDGTTNTVRDTWTAANYPLFGSRAIDDLLSGQSTDGLSDRFIISDVNDLWNGGANYAGRFALKQQTDALRFRLSDSTITTTAGANTWLQTNNATFYYPLATPSTVDLGTIEMPDVYDGVVVDVIAEVTPTITAEWKLANVVYLDYPHDYQYDYMKSSNNTEITTSVLTPSDVRITIFGAVSNPYIIVGDNRYQVNVTVPAGGYLEIDGREKTITLTLADGTQQNVFGAGVRGSGMGGGEYIFEPIKGGAQQVQWSGAFGFDLAWYEDEGEPPWSR